MARRDSGFVTVGVIILMLALAAISLEMADRSGHRVNSMALNQAAIQAKLGAQATVEYGLWQLTRDLSWRTSAAGQTYSYAGTTYTLKVLDSILTGYEDCVIITAAAEGAARATAIGIRIVSRPVIISDTQNNRIRALDLDTGLIFTVAGGGSGGNGVPATDARLTAPYDACVNSQGEIYIADTYSQTIRKVDRCGTISHVAGTLWAAGYAGDNGPAAAARLNVPMGVAVDAADNLYIADTWNHVIRRVDAVTGTITTVAGTGEGGDSTLYDGELAVDASLKEPNSLAFDASGNYFITDSKNNVVLRVDGVSGRLTVYAGQKKKRKDISGDGGLATDAFFSYPWGVGVGPGNHVFVTDTTYGTLRRVDAVSRYIDRVAGVDGFNGYTWDGIPATWSWLNYPCGVCVTDENDLIIADTNNHRIRRVNGATGLIETLAGTGVSGFSGDDGPGTAAQLNLPEEVNMGMPFLSIVPELCQ
nr:hypothetical protein [uncultured Desulfobacter sp.]